MAQADPSLSPILPPQYPGVAHALARHLARRAVEHQLRGQGVRVTLVKPADITAQANAYLANHPELYQQALERAQRMGLIKPMPIMVTPDRFAEQNS